MRTPIMLILLFSAPLPGLCDARHVPRDIRTFAANAEACEHLGGEYDGDLPPGEKRKIERDVRKYCGAASRQLPILRSKYRHNAEMLEVIRQYVNAAVTDYR